MTDAAWRSGDAILMRGIVDGRVRWALPHTLVELGGERVAWAIRPGTRGIGPVGGDRSDYVRDLARRDRRTGPREWHTHRVLRLTPLAAGHSLDLYWDEQDRFRGWYVNLQEPLRRSPFGFDTRDHALDIWVEPDGSWRWKDENELAEAVDLGVFTVADAAAIRAEGERVLEAQPWPTGWEDWRPDPSWPLPTLPAGWNLPWRARAGENPLMSVLAERVEELRGDTLHGSSWMARRAVETLLEVADEDADSTEEMLERLLAAGRELADSRPGVGAIAGAVGRVLAAAHGSAHLPPDELRRLVRMEADGLIAGRDRAKASIAIQLRERLTEAFVVTHSASATVREALLYTPPELVVCTVTQPHEEGRRLAEDLRGAGLNVELVEDADAPAALEHSTLLLLGADTVFRDGSVCNKVGTQRLAEAAAALDVWTVVGAEILKLAPIEAADAPPLTGEAAELFDITPADLIDAIVTDEGTVAGDEVRPLVDRTPFLAHGYALLSGE